MSTVTLRYWAAAKQAAGVAEETISAETLAAALEVALSARERNAAPARMAAFGRFWPGRRSWSTAPRWAGGRPRPWRCAEAAVVEVLPPFAGG